MCFLYMLNLLDFDSQGKVKETKETSLPQAQSNFLYLVCKFNQNFLKEKGLPVPEFFKEELSSVLENVEKGQDYETAKKTVFSNCLPQVSALANQSEKDIISALVKSTSAYDLEFADKFKEAKNHLQLEYIMTVISSKVLSKAEQLKSQPQTKENKSKLFKELIKYNALVNAAENVREDVNTFKQTVGKAG